MLQWQLIWKHWWKLWPVWKVHEDHSYKDLYPNMKLYNILFFFGPLQARWWRCSEISN